MTEKSSSEAERSSQAKPTLAALPLSIARSELFSVASKGEWYKAREIPTARKGINASIIYTGQHLTMEHLKAWQALVYLADRENALGGEGFVVPMADVLRLMGKKPVAMNSTQRKQFWQLLADLRATSITIKSNGVSYMGGLIDEAVRDEATHLVRVRIGQKIATELLDREILRNDLDRMMGFGRHHFAIWLHGFISSQASRKDKLVSRHTFEVDEIRRLCGSKAKERVHFVQDLSRALDKLKTGENPLVKDWDWSDEAKRRVWVDKTHTLVKVIGETATAAKAKRSDAAAQAAWSRKAKVAL